ncbi:hypothetical protein C8R45DRAFT_89229 [Mycena sanguinolenta]|nr:hypothetical protein C8R45DRAFT_89229 [Mycena sanguinolenta]
MHLPMELLAEIFELAIADHTYIKDVYRITQVCSDWRRVAHGTPQLWTRTLRVKLCRKGEAVDGLKAWLARSEPLPIRISFIPESGDVNSGILEEILKVVTRCCSLTINTVHLSWLVRQLSKCSLTSLEELKLGAIEENTGTTPISFTTVPRLRKLSMALNFPAAPQTLVPWAQLTDLALRGGDHDVQLGTLAQCVNLITASVTTRDWLPDTKRDIVVLRQLHTFSVRFMCRYSLACNITPFFDNLSTPVLRSLCLEFDNLAQWTESHFTAFQLRTCNITQLEFACTISFTARDPVLTSDDLATIIRHAPLLTHLKLTNCDNWFDDVVIRTLYANYEDGVAPLAPHLHNFVITSVASTFSHDILAGMIASRWWTNIQPVRPAVARWTHVQLYVGKNHWSPDFMDILKDIPSHVLVLNRYRFSMSMSH